jgi:hypothetical protein
MERENMQEMTDQELLNAVAEKLAQGKRLMQVAKELNKENSWLSRKIKELGYQVEWTGKLVPRKRPKLSRVA